MFSIVYNKIIPAQKPAMTLVYPVLYKKTARAKDASASKHSSTSFILYCLRMAGYTSYTGMVVMSVVTHSVLMMGHQIIR